MLKKSEYNVYFQVLVLCSVRRPIGFRPPSNQIPSAVQSDSERRPIGFRPPSDRIASAARCRRLRGERVKPMK